MEVNGIQNATTTVLHNGELNTPNNIEIANLGPIGEKPPAELEDTSIIALDINEKPSCITIEALEIKNSDSEAQVELPSIAPLTCSDIPSGTTDEKETLEVPAPDRAVIPHESTEAIIQQPVGNKVEESVLEPEGAAIVGEIANAQVDGPTEAENQQPVDNKTEEQAEVPICEPCIPAVGVEEVFAPVTPQTEVGISDLGNDEAQETARGSELPEEMSNTAGGNSLSEEKIPCPGDSEETYPITSLQLGQINPALDAACQVRHYAYKLPLDTDQDRLGQSWLELLQRHEILRTSFRNASSDTPSWIGAVQKKPMTSFKIVTTSPEDLGLSEATKRAETEKNTPVTKETVLEEPSSPKSKNHKKTKSVSKKKKRVSKYVDKRKPTEDDFMSDPMLYESFDRKIVTDVGGRLDEIVGDFWDAPSTENEIDDEIRNIIASTSNPDAKSFLESPARATLIQGQTQFVFIASLHKFVHDIASVPLIFDDLWRIYNSACLVDRRQFLDITSQTGDSVEATMEFWLKSIVGYNSPGFQFSDKKIASHNSISIRIDDFTNTPNATADLPNFALLAFGKAICRLQETQDIVIGYTTTGRSIPGNSEDVIVGPLSNTLPFRVTLNPTDFTNDDLLNQIKKNAEESAKHLKVSFVEIEKRWQSSHNHDRELINCIFSYQKSATEEQAIPWKPYKLPDDSETISFKHDLEFEIFEEKDARLAVRVHAKLDQNDLYNFVEDFRGELTDILEQLGRAARIAEMAPSSLLADSIELDEDPDPNYKTIAFCGFSNSNDVPRSFIPPEAHFLPSVIEQSSNVEIEIFM
jgi:hypothetical protein